MEELFCDKEMDNKEGQKNVLKKKKFCKGIHIKQAQIKNGWNSSKSNNIRKVIFLSIPYCKKALEIILCITLTFGR